MESSIKNFNINIFAECQALRWGLWKCPPFLFLVMGITTIISMIATYAIASKYADEPHITALIVIAISSLFFVVGNLIVTGFNKIAEANRMKSDFISLISHQLRSPLTIFKWTVNSAEREAQTKQPIPDIKTLLATLHTTSEYMIRLVNSLLEVSRIDAHAITLNKEEVYLSKLVAHIVANFENYASASNISLICTAEENLPLITADRDRVMMVIGNLLDNAIRYSQSASSIEISVRKTGSFLNVSVHDNGAGIPPEQQKFVFKKFFRATNSSALQTRGTGIGLYIAKAIIEESGGKIGFASEEKKGSTFWFTLPIGAHT